ncbi:Alanine racemase [Dirofilaria immitis]
MSNQEGEKNDDKKGLFQASGLSLFYISVDIIKKKKKKKATATIIAAAAAAAAAAAVAVAATAIAVAVPFGNTTTPTLSSIHPSLFCRRVSTEDGWVAVRDRWCQAVGCS